MVGAARHARAHTDFKRGTEKENKKTRETNSGGYYAYIHIYIKPSYKSRDIYMYTFVIYRERDEG